MFPHVDPTLTVDNLTAVLRLVEGSMKNALPGVEWSFLLKRVDKCILNLEQRAAAASMCYISSHYDDPTWKYVARRLHVAGEEKAAMATKAYLLPKGNVSM